ncbi:G2/M phase-specific E3 ubiquitin-protein ligase-like isoform X3 [Neoarius graeffei]|nr:G2/M phase-specific E3 ubiquitin-protein ligase-like isoform X3 [Neoarius graeffei]
MAQLEALEGPSRSFSVAAPTDSTTDEWQVALDPAKAAILFREALLKTHDSGPPLCLRMDLRESPEDQDRTIVAFYKAHQKNWAGPLNCKLEGDTAIGEGVTRFFSICIQKLRSGFSLNCGNANITQLFEGEPDYLVPSSSLLVDSDLFQMAGRMLGHSFLHGGPGFVGMSQAILHVLLGGSPGVATVTIKDCPDVDIRETITLLDGTSELSEQEKARVQNLAFAWDLPRVTENNRRWLCEKMLLHSVIGRTTRQVKQLRKGLKETHLWHLMTEKPDVVPLIFPREKDASLTSEAILRVITWPSATDDDSEDECPVETTSRITGYLREFIENASSNDWKELLRFWTGWEVLPRELIVAMTSSKYPRAATCFETLCLPTHYTDFRQFQKDLEACIKTSNTGFGLI